MPDNLLGEIFHNFGTSGEFITAVAIDEAGFSNTLVTDDQTFYKFHFCSCQTTVKCDFLLPNTLAYFSHHEGERAWFVKILIDPKVVIEIRLVYEMTEVMANFMYF